MRRFDQFREDLKSIQDGEQRLLCTRQAEAERGQRLAYAALWTGTIVTGTIVTLLICAGIGGAINRRIARPLIPKRAGHRMLGTLSHDREPGQLNQLRRSEPPIPAAACAASPRRIPDNPCT